MNFFSKDKPDITTHAADTWLLANGLHLIILLVIFWQPFDFSHIWIMILFALIILAASLPCLMMAYFSLSIIARGLLPKRTLFLVWLIVCPSIVLLEGMLGFMLLKDSTAFTLSACVPGMFAALFAVLVRYRQFGQLIDHYKKHAAI